MARGCKGILLYQQKSRHHRCFIIPILGEHLLAEVCFGFSLSFWHIGRPTVTRMRNQIRKLQIIVEVLTLDLLISLFCCSALSSVGFFFSFLF